MSAASGRLVKERRIIDVDAVRGDFFAAQLEHVGERHRYIRAIVARVGHDPFAGYRRASAASHGAHQMVVARGDRREKLGGGDANRLGANDRRSIAKPELRVGSQKADECRRVASVDGRKQPLPPGFIRLKDTLCCGWHMQSILDPLSTCPFNDR
jgi:hypothetical protein